MKLFKNKEKTSKEKILDSNKTTIKESKMRKIFFLSLWLLCGMTAMAKEIKPDTITS